MKPKKEIHVSESKKRLVTELKDLIKKKKTILIASIKNIPAAQFQSIGKKLRANAVIKVPKKNLIFRAIDESKDKELEKLKEKLESDFAILFSDQDSFDLALELIKNKNPAKAKAGQIALEDIEVPEGPTELVPGPAISELGALGIQVQIEKGKINIKQAKIIARKGEKISNKAADMMGKLDIKPFSIGFTPVCSFDNVGKKLYLEIKINREGTLNDLKTSFGKALPFAMGLGYISEDTIRPFLSKAASHEKRLIKIISGEPEETHTTETPKEEKKEEVKVDATAGLAGLFG
jgi:ribosomal protein L10